MTKEYNGYTNRATWLTNLYFRDDIMNGLQDMVDIGDINRDTDEDDLASKVESIISPFLEDMTEDIDGFILDLLDLGEIDYYDLADTHKEDLDFSED